jgi:uncharacterized membrane protein YozB (DUF420 family)
MSTQPGILGTQASLASDLSLLAYLLLLVPLMLLGFAFARRKMFVPHHKIVMTLIVALNWVLIALIMAVSYRDGVAPYLSTSLTDPRVLLPTLHLIIGGIAQILGTYLVLRMWLEDILPAWLKVKRIKRYMRLTLAMWLVTAALGVIIYLMFYPIGTRAGAPSEAPVVTAEPDASAIQTVEPAVTEEAGE